MDARAVILDSVGEGGSNQTADVRIVQRLLNDWLSSANQTELKVDGLAGPKTTAAIVAFQKANIGVADGKVDPGRRTINLLFNQHLSRLLKSIDVSGIDDYVDKSRLTESALADPTLLPVLNSYIAELRKSA
jgi:peptidoglycan hydrolase-like protein with peptidoglycan-binding domain